MFPDRVTWGSDDRQKFSGNFSMFATPISCPASRLKTLDRVKAHDSYRDGTPLCRLVGIVVTEPAFAFGKTMLSIPTTIRISSSLLFLFLNASWSSSRIVSLIGHSGKWH